MFATILGYLLSRSTCSKTMQPFLVASQAIPTVAIAPLLVIWFARACFQGADLALIVFFPVLVTPCRPSQRAENRATECVHSALPLANHRCSTPGRAAGAAGLARHRRHAFGDRAVVCELVGRTAAGVLINEGRDNNDTGWLSWVFSRW